MPNRIIKESITTSTSLANLTAEEERHFYRLIVQADDFGCFQAHTSIVRARGYALMIDKVKDSECLAWTLALVRENIIHLYNAGGKLYGHFVNWEKYQQLRAKRRKWPEPTCDSICNQMIADDSICARNPNPNLNPNVEPPIGIGDAGGEPPGIQQQGNILILPQKATPGKTKPLPVDTGGLNPNIPGSSEIFQEVPRKPKKPLPVDEAFIQSLVHDFSEALGGENEVREAVKDAQAHKNWDKWKDKRRYVSSWLRRSVGFKQQRNGSSGDPPATSEEIAKMTKKAFPDWVERKTP